MGLDVELRVNSPALLILGVLKTHVNFLQRTNRREKKRGGGGRLSKARKSDRGNRKKRRPCRGYLYFLFTEVTLDC